MPLQQSFQDGDRGTEGHPIWSNDRLDWVPLSELKEGESVQVQGGYAKVQCIQETEDVEKVYTIEVDADHCYRVGEQGLLVHNASEYFRGQKKAENSKRLLSVYADKHGLREAFKAFKALKEDQKKYIADQKANKSCKDNLAELYRKFFAEKGLDLEEDNPKVGDNTKQSDKYDDGSSSPLDTYFEQHQAHSDDESILFESFFIGVTEDARVACYWARIDGGIVYNITLEPRRVRKNKANKQKVPAGDNDKMILEREYLVPVWIHDDEITGSTEV